MATCVRLAAVASPGDGRRRAVPLSEVVHPADSVLNGGPGSRAAGAAGAAEGRVAGISAQSGRSAAAAGVERGCVWRAARAPGTNSDIVTFVVPLP